MVGLLDLPAVDDLLTEDAELVTDAVGDRRDLERGERIDETRRQPAETAAAQSRLLFLVQQLLEVQAELAQALPHRLDDAEIQEIVAEMRPGQKLGGQIGDGPRPVPGVFGGRADPALQHAVAHRVGERHVVVVLRGQGGEFPQHVEQIV